MWGTSEALAAVAQHSAKPVTGASFDFLGLAVAAAVAAVLSAATGVYALRTLTIALEGHYEFKGDSLTKRSRTGGFIRFIVWAVLVAVAWSFFIDWFWFQDFGFAMTMLWVRLEIVLTILEALGDN